MSGHDMTLRNRPYPSSSTVKPADLLTEGVELTLGELEDMAVRQQAQIDSQRQLIAAKEQRLRFLKQHEARHQQVAAEHERLRRLRDRVEQQEMKLRKLRALRGQVDQNKTNNVSLSSDLESIRALFNEKEKELCMAVAKVEELTHQLEDLKRGRTHQPSHPHLSAELENLRRELMYHNKLSEQQNVRLHQQRETLTKKQAEVNSVDLRISELQERLQRKRLLNQQLASQLNSNINASQHQLPPGKQQLIAQNSALAQINVNSLFRSMTSSNIAAVAPYLHVPSKPNLDNTHAMFQNQRQVESGHNHDRYPPSKMEDPRTHMKHKASENVNLLNNNEGKIPEFSANKSDPKYQTLPYNTKFAVNYLANTQNFKSMLRRPGEGNENISPAGSESSGGSSMIKEQLVHSIPIPSQVSKGLAIPALRNYMSRPVNQTMSSMAPSNSSSNSTSISTSQTQSSSSNNNNVAKPISSVAPVALHEQQQALVFQAASTKVHPVQPITLVSSSHQINIGKDKADRVESHTEGETLSPKPALPPKPAVPIKSSMPPPPPRQSNATATDNTEEETKSINNVDANKNNVDNVKTGHIEQRIFNLNLRDTDNNKRINGSIAISTQELDPSQPRRATLSIITKDTSLPPPLPTTEPPSDDNLNNNVDTDKSDKEKTTESPDQTDRVTFVDNSSPSETSSTQEITEVIKSALKSGKLGKKRCVSFDPLALLLDASLEGELELVMKTARLVKDPSAANDEGITALHNAICAGHFDIVRFLVQFGCDVNAQDSDGWMPLHCAASCNNLAMVRFLVEHGACIFATTHSDHETAAVKCEEDEEGFEGCSEFLYSVQEKLGILNNGAVYALYDYEANNQDELTFKTGECIIVLRKGDENEREWWWSKLNNKEGYVPRNLLGLYPRVQPQ
uniref:Apoptosis-stimulating of p53 protein 2 n=1 Tax=Cacopsylla melanoneura TaxID=428564 RepID=A0A8D8XQU9_9HEMI